MNPSHIPYQGQPSIPPPDAQHNYQPYPPRHPSRQSAHHQPAFNTSPGNPTPLQYQPYYPTAPHAPPAHPASPGHLSQTHSAPHHPIPHGSPHLQQHPASHHTTTTADHRTRPDDGPPSANGPPSGLLPPLTEGPDFVPPPGTLYGPPQGALATSYVGNYVLYGTIGEGAFGKVKIAVDRRTNARVAVKIMDKGEIRAQDITAQVRREIYIMRCLKHKHIVRLNEVLTSDTKLYIVMELVTGGELFDRIEKGRVSEDMARQYFQQLIDGVDFCHKKGVAHRDLKPENLLLDENGEIKITDFGFSSMKGMDVNTGLLYTQCGTPDYCAPEIINNAQKGYTGAKVDAWSCGIILYALLCGRLPFQEHDTEKLYDLILACQVRYPDTISPGARDLLQNLLVRDPNNRYDLQKVKRHPWFLVAYEGDDARLLKKRPFFNKKNQKDLSESVPSSPTVPPPSNQQQPPSVQSESAPSEITHPSEPPRSDGASFTHPQSVPGDATPNQHSGPSSPVLASDNLHGAPDEGAVSSSTRPPRPPSDSSHSHQGHPSMQYVDATQVNAQAASDATYSGGPVERRGSVGVIEPSPRQTSFNDQQSLNDGAAPRSLPSGAITSPAVTRLREEQYAKYNQPNSPSTDLTNHVRAPTPPSHEVFTKVEDRPATPARRQTTASVAAAFKAAVASSRIGSEGAGPAQPAHPTGLSNIMANGVPQHDPASGTPISAEPTSSSAEAATFSAPAEPTLRAGNDDSSSDHDSVEDYENKPAPLLEMPAHPRQLLRMTKEGRRPIHSLPHAQQLRQRSDLAAAAITTAATSSPPSMTRGSTGEQGSASLSAIQRRRLFGSGGPGAAFVNDPRSQRLRPSDQQSSTPPVVYSPSPVEGNSFERFRSMSPGFSQRHLSDDAAAGHHPSGHAYANGYGYNSKDESTPSSGGLHAEMFSRRLWNMVTKLRGTTEPVNMKLSRELRRDLQVLVNELKMLNKGEAWTVLTNFLSLFEIMALGDGAGSSTTYGSAITARPDDESSREQAPRVVSAPHPSNTRSMQPEVSSEEESVTLSPVVMDSGGPHISDLARRRDMSDLLNKWIKTADKRLEEGADGEDSSQFVDLMELQRLMRKHHSGREESNLADDLLRLMNGSEEGATVPFASMGNPPGQSPPPPHVSSTRSADSYTQPRYMNSISASAGLTRPPIPARSVSNNNAPLPSEYVPGRFQEANPTARIANDRINPPSVRTDAETSVDELEEPEAPGRANPSHMANSMGMGDVPYYISDKKSGMATKLRGVLQTMKTKNHKLGEYYAQFKSGLPPDEIMRLIGRVLQDMGAKVTIKRETKRKMKCQLIISPSVTLHAGIELIDSDEDFTIVSFRRSKADKGKTDTESFHTFYERVKSSFVDEANTQYPSMRLDTANSASRRRRRRKEETSRHVSDTNPSSVSGG